MDPILTGRTMDAAEAERSGLVSRVVPADDLLTEARATATTISQMSASAARMAKEAVNRAFESSLSEGCSTNAGFSIRLSRPKTNPKVWQRSSRNALPSSPTDDGTGCSDDHQRQRRTSYRR